MKYGKLKKKQEKLETAVKTVKTMNCETFKPFPNGFNKLSW